MPSSPTRARQGISLMFFTNGILFSVLLPRYPELKSALSLSNTAFGLAVIAMPMGAILAAALSAPLMRRLGTRAVMTAGTALVALMVFLAGTSHTVWVFAGALLVAGFVDSIVDAAQNVQGVLVEQWMGKSVINSLHALWSLGATLGGLAGSWCAAQHIPLFWMLLVNGVIWSASAFFATPSGVVATDDDGHEPGAAGARTRAWKLLAPLVVLAICGTLIEEVANSWSALFMRTELSASAGLAGLGFTTMLGAQFIGRMAGDPMTDRWGRERVARLGGVVIAVGALVSIIAPSAVVALMGLALMGFGCATLVPAAFAAAARVPGLPHGTGVAVMGWLMRLGFLCTSPIIGLVSDQAGLRTALVVPLVAGVAAAGIAHWMRRALAPAPAV
ncbi:MULTISPECIES: MFS transporter [unclassified Luteococcus]|uniref:MFS transporter n=1 Tax=unclassified Luteococcus TaxID=2639923 RepID=UPI00313CABA7